jgi:hypothetical protein
MLNIFILFPPRICYFFAFYLSVAFVAGHCASSVASFEKVASVGVDEDHIGFAFGYLIVTAQHAKVHVLKEWRQGYNYRLEYISQLSSQSL